MFCVSPPPPRAPGVRSLLYHPAELSRFLKGPGMPKETGQREWASGALYRAGPHGPQSTSPLGPVESRLLLKQLHRGQDSLPPESPYLLSCPPKIVSVTWQGPASRDVPAHLLP